MGCSHFTAARQSPAGASPPGAPATPRHPSRVTSSRTANQRARLFFPPPRWRWQPMGSGSWEEGRAVSMVPAAGPGSGRGDGGGGAGAAVGAHGAVPGGSSPGPAARPPHPALPSQDGRLRPRAGGPGLLPAAALALLAAHRLREAAAEPRDRLALLRALPRPPRARPAAPPALGRGCGSLRQRRGAGAGAEQGKSPGRPKAGGAPSPPEGGPGPA